MTDNIKAIDFNGVKIKLDDNTVLIQLAGASVTGTVTMNDTRDATKYQVPVGKKATIIFITDGTWNAASDKLIFADDEDGTTNAVTLFEPLAVIANLIFISAEVPAEKFLNVTDNTTGTYDIHIVEENA